MLIPTKNILVLVGCMGFSLQAMDLIHIIGEDQDNHIYQVESLNQFDPSQGELASTACGYYALNNCIKLIEILTSSFKKNIRVDGLSKISEKFATLDSEQRQVIFINRLIMKIQELIKSSLGSSKLYKSLTEKNQDSFVQLIRLTIQHVSSSSNPLIKDGTIKWVFKEEELIRSFQAMCNNRSDYAESLEPIEMFLRENSDGLQKIDSLLWAYIAQLSPTFMSYENRQLSFSFSATSSVAKEIDYGNWLDSYDITSLIDRVNSTRKEEFIIEALNMTGSFIRHFKDSKHNSHIKGKEFDLEDTVEEYEYLNYRKLKEVRNTLLTTKENVVAGFVIHTHTEAPVSGAGWLFSYFLPEDFLTSLLGTNGAYAHWIALVVVRQNQGPVSYYVADSFNNKNRLQSSLIYDIKHYLEGKKSRVESQFHIPQLSDIEVLNTPRVIQKRLVSEPVTKGGGSDSKTKEEGTSSISSRDDAHENALAALALIGSGIIYLSVKQKTNEKEKNTDASKKPKASKAEKKESIDDSSESLSVVSPEAEEDKLREKGYVREDG